eukprot:TRINITY_DN11101_c0_g1_i1.p1 TRINITY_DN11101_c0_g1~~TRINITY_DN11101_c0_g1_i1.p1  ORF type:complete len:431 (+),score=95.45 TRINITY_DN11101_c0_g1_i1:77-1369(+)
MGWLLSSFLGETRAAATKEATSTAAQTGTSKSSGFNDFLKPRYEHANLQPVDLRPKKVPNAIVSKDDALPGRSEPLKVSDKHYILQTPMKGPWPENLEVLVLANGCFWGSEKGYWRLPGGGVYSTAVGYAGGWTPNPNYEEVCSGKTGHTEAVQVVFDPEKISVADILRWFWESHDPTQGMGQGNDRGTQYRSAVYYFNEDQRLLAEASKTSYQQELTAMGKGMGKRITTEIKAASEFADSTVFYYAEDSHQQYLAKPGARPYCSAQPLGVRVRPFKEWAPASLQERCAPKFDEEFWSLYGSRQHSVIKAPHEPIQWQAQKPHELADKKQKKLTKGKTAKGGVKAKAKPQKEGGKTPSRQKESKAEENAGAEAPAQVVVKEPAEEQPADVGGRFAEEDSGLELTIPCARRTDPQLNLALEEVCHSIVVSL